MVGCAVACVMFYTGVLKEARELAMGTWGDSPCRGPGAGPGLVCCRNSEQARVSGAECEGAEGRSCCVRPCGLREDLGFNQEGGVSPGGPWAEEW